MELFRLFGTIMVSDEEAVKTLKALDKKGYETQKTLQGISDVGDKIGKALVAGVVVGATALAGLVVKGVMGADELKKSLNGLQSSTGSTDVEMIGLKKSLLSIYNQNFGESYQDIADSMGEIQRQTGLTGKALESATKNALMLRDAFDFEVNESIRSANMLMDTFGVSGEEAYNLIAQGAQKGLDKNGDLLDTVNEYSVHFKQLGFNSEEMFNMLVNGAKSGTFSVDKLGDAVKEFGIRTKDGSDGTKEAFKSLGLDVNKTGKDFAEGGEKGKEAFNKVTEALFNMKDPMKQNEIGVALFGTQWEDLGAKGVEALLNVNGEISNTNNALKEIEKIKYDSFGEAISGIGRQFETGVLIPVGEKVLPKLNEFANFLVENMPEIQKTVEGAMLAVVDIFNKFVDAIIWAKDNANILIPVLSTLAGIFISFGVLSLINSAMTAYGTAVSTLTVLTSLLNIAKLKDIAQTTILNALYAKDAIVTTISSITSLITISATLAISKATDIIQTTALNILYAKDAVVKGISTAAQIAHNVAVGAWNIICGIATIATTAFGAAVAFLTSPIGIVIAIIAGLIAVGVLLYKNWDVVKAKATELWGNITSIFNGMKSSITTAFNGIMTSASNTINNIKSTFSKVADYIATPFRNAVSTVTGLIDKVKSAAANIFKSIKTPKFSISGSLNPATWIKNGLPKLNVNWNAKGAIFNKPTIFDTPYGLQGVGDAKSPEVVAPLHKLQEMLDFNKDDDSSLLQEVIALLRALLAKDANVYMDGKEVGTVLSPVLNDLIFNDGIGRGVLT